MISKNTPDTRRGSEIKWLNSASVLNRAYSNDIKTLITKPRELRKVSLTKDRRIATGCQSKPEFSLMKNRGTAEHSRATDHRPRRKDALKLKLESPGQSTPGMEQVACFPAAKSHTQLQSFQQVERIAKVSWRPLPKAASKTPILSLESFNSSYLPNNEQTNRVPNAIEATLRTQQSSLSQWIATHSENGQVPLAAVEGLLTSCDGLPVSSLMLELCTKAFIPATSLYHWYKGLREAEPLLQVKQELEARLTYFKVEDLPSFLDTVITEPFYDQKALRSLFETQLKIGTAPGRSALVHRILNSASRVPATSLRTSLLSLLSEWEPTDTAPARLMHMLHFSLPRLVSALDEQAQSRDLSVFEVIELLEECNVIQTNIERLWMLGYLYSFSESMHAVAYSQAFAELATPQQVRDSVEAEISSANTTFENTSLLTTCDLDELR